MGYYQDPESVDILKQQGQRVPSGVTIEGPQDPLTLEESYKLHPNIAQDANATAKGEDPYGEPPFLSRLLYDSARAGGMPSLESAPNESMLIPSSSGNAHNPPAPPAMPQSGIGEGLGAAEANMKFQDSLMKAQREIGDIRLIGDAAGRVVASIAGGAAGAAGAGAGGAVGGGAAGAGVGAAAGAEGGLGAALGGGGGGMGGGGGGGGMNPILQMYLSRLLSTQ